MEFVDISSGLIHSFLDVAGEALDAGSQVRVNRL